MPAFEYRAQDANGRNCRGFKRLTAPAMLASFYVSGACA